MAKFSVQILTPTIGAVVQGVDLSKQLGDDEIAQIRTALLRHKVIFFEDQHITPVQHRDFAARFGPLHTHPLYPGVPEAPEMFVLDNHAGNPTDNDAWHTDVTFIETPPLARSSMRSCCRPKAETRAGPICRRPMKACPGPLQRFLAELDAVHDFNRGFPQGGQVAKQAGKDKAGKALEEHPPVIHPVVRTHPETGADGLFVNYGFTDRIKGLRRNESAALLNMLFVHIQQPEFQVRWRWKPNSIAFWDNRITQHYAVNDYLPNRRVMNRATILGDRPFHRSRVPAAAKAAE